MSSKLRQTSVENSASISPDEGYNTSEQKRGKDGAFDGTVDDSKSRE